MPGCPVPRAQVPRRHVPLRQVDGVLVGREVGRLRARLEALRIALGVVVADREAPLAVRLECQVARVVAGERAEEVDVEEELEEEGGAHRSDQDPLGFVELFEDFSSARRF